VVTLRLQHTSLRASILRRRNCASGDTPATLCLPRLGGELVSVVPDAGAPGYCTGSLDAEQLVGSACWWLTPLYELVVATVPYAPKILADGSNI
jgi:hypothetical protein